MQNGEDPRLDLRLGIIGATGYIGTPYRREIREDGRATIVSLCARRMDRLKEAASQDNAAHVTNDWREVVEHPDVNTVMVLTPDAHHFEPVMRSAELGKHVFCEKPIGGNSKQAGQMWNAARRSKLASFVPFWTRYVPAFARAKQLVDEGKLGEIKNFVYRWHNPRPISMPFTWRDDATLSAAGSLADVGSHAYDALRFILRDEANRVLAHTSVVMPPKPDLGEIDLNEALEWGSDLKSGREAPFKTTKGSAPDYAMAGIEFHNGAIGSMVLSHASYLRKGFGPELELHGTKGSLSVDRITGQLLFSNSPDPASLFETCTEPQAVNRFTNFVFPAMETYLDDRNPLHADLEDGYRVQVFTDAAVASANRATWVDLDEFLHQEAAA